MISPAVWFPAVRAHSGADAFTERLCAGLEGHGIRAEITWLPLRAEYAPWSVAIPEPPAWANIVHVNTWLHPRFLPRNLPVVATMHLCVHDSAMEPFKTLLQQLYHRLWIRRIEAGILRRAELITAVSHYSAKRTHEVFGCRSIQVIHNGVDTNTFHPLPRFHPNTPFRLLYVGNWSERKGVRLISTLLEQLGPDFELYYTADRKNGHQRYWLPDNCHCLGRPSTGDLVHAYQTSDALLFPSRLEGFGLVAAEAMACGLPVIATESSSLPEVVEDRVTGLLCPVDDLTGFAEAARALKNDPALWQSMRKAARVRAVRLFDEKRQVSRYVDFYKAVLARTNPGL